MGKQFVKPIQYIDVQVGMGLDGMQLQWHRLFYRKLKLSLGLPSSKQGRVHNTGMAKSAKNKNKS